ncbi:rootletin-like, partial [Thunnus maccoyii]|uniref:rootletin-like n=1 Tax=Thunnus maccoyii TaxID=8240 RepID=UPI001C4BC3D7
MDSEKAALQREVCRLQEELAESRAEREELESRSRALNDRLCQSLSPSLALSLRVEGEQREWRRRVREGREREARQALLIHRLQNKVLEYRDRCQSLELHLQDEHTELLNTERKIRDEHSDSLESALIRLEEEQQRSVGLVDTNTLLREQLSQSEQANQALREDVQKLTADWTRAVEEAEQREADWQREKECRAGNVGQQQDRLLSVWRSVVTLRRHCHTIKTATDRDLWQLRAEFSRVSSSLLSSCDSVSSSLRFSAPPIRPSPSGPPLPLPPDLPPPLSSTLLHPPPSLSPPLPSTLVLLPPDSLASVPPLTSSSTLGTFSLGELEHKEEEEREMSELKFGFYVDTRSCDPEAHEPGHLV